MPLIQKRRIKDNQKDIARARRPKSSGRQNKVHGRQIIDFIFKNGNVPQKMIDCVSSNAKNNEIEIRPATFIRMMNKFYEIDNKYKHNQKEIEILQNRVAELEANQLDDDHNHFNAVCVNFQDFLCAD